jgi:iron complex outermembrane receptor protein
MQTGFVPIVLCLAACVRAQDLSISGTVRDATGVVPGVHVSLRGPGGDRSGTSDAEGKYNFGMLSVGRYELTFERQGFARNTQTVFLAAGESKTVDGTITVAGVSASVEVIDSAGKATASRMDVPDREIPVQVSTISQETLESQGVNDMVTALRNASGVTAQRWYGIYEYYTIRGFNSSDVQLVDGMRLEGNRFNTQLNNVEEITVLKGPSSVLYGNGALGGTINIIRKKPQGTRAYDFFYRGGRFNTHQVAGGAAGPLIRNKLLYRVDSSFDHSEGWRGAGANRFNASPALTWLISEKARVTVHQAFNRDKFKGDGGLPLALIALPGFDLNRRLNTPWDFGLVKDSQTHVLLNVNLSPRWEFRNGFFNRATNDEYFVNEGEYYEPGDTEVFRDGLYFLHRRRPKLNQADVVGRFDFLRMKHTVVMGYEYQDFYSATDVTPDGGYFEFTPLPVPSFTETQPPITTFPLARRTYFSNRINGIFWQDQISIGSNLKLNVGGRYDDYLRLRRRDFYDNGRFTRAEPETRQSQTAYTYRAGAVYAPVSNTQVYFSASSTFTPVTIIPPSGPPLNPETGQGYELGHRHQALRGRLQISQAVYWLYRQRVPIRTSVRDYDQIGQVSSRGYEIDVTGDAGYGARLVANYGYARSRFDDYNEGDGGLSGNRPRFTPAHTANLWLTKSWNKGFTAGAGVRYWGSMFTNSANTIKLGGWTTFTGMFGYRKGKMEWTVNAENLLNRARYFLGSDYDNQVYPGAPIGVFSTIRFRFN